MQWHLIFICLFSIFFFCNSSAQTNDLVFQHLTRSNGLPVGAVSCLAQDSSGFIWIGSSEGLYRYDGFNFKAFYADFRPGNSLASNLISKICVTKKGLICVGTLKGGIVMMNSSGKIIKAFNSSTSANFSTDSDWIIDIREDKLGNIWLSTADGLFKIFSDRIKIERFDLDKARSGYNGFSQFVFDDADNIWIGSRTGVYLFNTSKNSFTSPTFHFLSDAPQCQHVKCLVFHNDQLWHSTYAPDLACFDTSKKKNAIFYSGKGLKTPDFSRMSNLFYTDSKNTLWIGTGKGLYVVEPGKASISASFVHEPSNLFSICGNTIYAILEDRDGNLWLGTDGGISIARPYGQFIHNLSVNNVKNYPFGSKAVNDIIEIDSNTLLLGTYEADGLYLTDRNFQIKKHFSFNNYRYDWVWKHFDDVSRKRILISTQDGMLIYDKVTGNLAVDRRETFKRWYAISSFVPVSDSIVWLSQLRGYFVRYNLNTGHFTEYDLKTFGEEGKVSSLEKDSENNIWVLAGRSGLIKFDQKLGKITDRIALSGPENLREGGIFFFKDLGNVFIIGYQSKGVSLYYKKSRTFQHFTMSEGLTSDGTRDAVVAKDGRVWIATINGLIQFDPYLQKFKSYGYADGILTTSFECITQLSDGRIVAGSTKGITVFDPRELVKLDKLPVPPVFTDISLYGKNISVDSLFDSSRPLQISYNKNYFSIDFVSLQYNSSRQLEYARMLEGLDKQWIDMGNKHFVSYANIKGGHYHFRVKVREAGGKWVESSRALPVDVTTAFYKQWWFYLLCALLIVVIVYGVFRYRLKQLLKIERMRTTISGDLHDEIGASLTSISIFSEMAMKNLSPNSKEEKYLHRIGERSRESIEKMSDIVWSINPANDNLEQVLVRMKNYSTEVSEAKDIAVSWYDTGNLSQAKLSMEQRKNFYLLFKEIINNAVKHSKAKNIFINLVNADGNIILTVKDDGVGFDTDVLTSGNGIKNIKRRIQLLKGQVKIDSGNGKGTSVKLNFSAK